MNIVVFGATGGTGREVVIQALAAGHHVTAVARNPAMLDIKHAQLEILQGDVLKPETVTHAVEGKDVVVSALGTTNTSVTRVYSAGLMNILLAMHAANVRRLICVSATGLSPGNLIQKVIAKTILWTLFKEGYTDMLYMETIVRASDVDWTIVRPPRLTDKPRTGKYQVAVKKQLPNAWLISRADLADYIVKHLNDPALTRAMVEVAN